MASLNIHLQEGFENDAVTLRVDGREVYAKAALSTRTQIGLADLIELEVPDPRDHVLIEVSVPTRHQYASFPVALRQTPWVGVSLNRDGRIEHRESSVLMGYL